MKSSGRRRCSGRKNKKTIALGMIGGWRTSHQSSLFFYTDFLMADEFYKDGLRFQCQPNCGACCSQKGDVFVNGEEVHRLATFLRMPTPQFRKRYLRRVHSKYSLLDNQAGGCIFLGNDLKCTVYEARPDQCRSYPFWPHILVSQLAWDWESLKCPGIGQGNIISAKDIKKRSEPAPG